MSCKHAEEDVCEHCLEKVQYVPKKYAEDVCENCLEKVQTTTEKKDSPPEKTMKNRDKKIFILMYSSLLAAGGATWYFHTKYFLNMVSESFDSILDILSARTKKE